jgi:uncharacterized protein
MGLLREGINEVIATTRGNAAPMGVILREGKITMVVFRESHTAARISSDGWVAANFLFDPVMYVKCAFADLPASAVISENAGGIPFERLTAAEAWAGFRADVDRTTSEALMVRLFPVCECIIKPVVHPVNRGFNSIIEATVHATRWTRTRDPALAGLIRHHAGIVRKCGGTDDMKALSLLYAYLPDLPRDDGPVPGDR